MLIGYARVSTDDQNLDLQRDALRAAGCERHFEEKLSGAAARLPVRGELLEYVRAGDVVVVWRLDRLGRSLADLVAVVTDLAERSIGLRSLHFAARQN
jgi:DNA invertase Pin-like site-specific DNA recombinase